MAKVVILFLTAAVVGGCFGFPRVTPVDSRIRFRATDAVSAGERRVWIHGSTESRYPCLGYQIRYVQSRFGHTTWIEIRGIAEPSGSCATAVGPAVCSIPFGRLQAGSYPIWIAVEGERVAASLIVSAESLEVRGGESRWTTFLP